MPEARIVEKDTMVYFPDVNFGGMTREDRARCGLKIERDMQVLGEMVQSAEWQDTECLICADYG